MTKGFFEESYDWDNDIMEITQRFVYEMDEARISNIADHFKVDLSEIRKYIEMKIQQQSKPVTNADRIRGMTDEEMAEWLVQHDEKCFHSGHLSRHGYITWLKEEVPSHE